ncbi:hypothetical protein [Flectobacillus rivi]|uniref:Integron-associated effector binding protein domain-containing protein n=1 Tax=Flectobacillus rivi TaxID=2984209 RepID=A0ABT6Z2Y3_9BACT|nr:hypothetical protein [Flectobacillus rivi]MDI9874946.1 hypothetical protein [Flectobacillus rivi]
MAHNQEYKKEESDITVHGSFTVIEDDIDSPPSDLKSNFISIEEWLGSICDEDFPQKPIDEYRIGLFESEQSYTLTLAGFNSYEKDKYTIVNLVEFEPTNIYFPLPENYFRDSSREQLLEKLIGELKVFTSTEKFKASFLSKGNVGVFETTGEIIWSNTDSGAK